MALDKDWKSKARTNASHSSTEQPAGAAEVSTSERQQPPGKEQTQSALQQHGEQQKRAQESQSDVQQNIGPDESEPPLAQARYRAGATFQPRGRYRKP